VSRDGSAVGTISGRSFRDVNRQRLARTKRNSLTGLMSVRSLDGAPIASGYYRPNPSNDGFDDTVVLTVTAALTVPLASLVLAWWLSEPQFAHIDVQGGGG
jgi:hypothetical protein